MWWRLLLIVVADLLILIFNVAPLVRRASSTPLSLSRGAWLSSVLTLVAVLAINVIYVRRMARIQCARRRRLKSFD